MDKLFYDPVQRNMVCISNYCVERIEFGAEEANYFLEAAEFERILLLTAGSIKGCDLTNSVYTEFEAPHMIVLEKDKEYAVTSQSTSAQLYILSALRHKNGDFVNPENLIRDNYPFDTTRSFEDQ